MGFVMNEHPVDPMEETKVISLQNPGNKIKFTRFYYLSHGFSELLPPEQFGCTLLTLMTCTSIYLGLLGWDARDARETCEYPGD